MFRRSESNLIPKESFWIHHEFLQVGVEISARIPMAMLGANSCYVSYSMAASEVRPYPCSIIVALAVRSRLKFCEWDGGTVMRTCWLKIVRGLPFPAVLLLFSLLAACGGGSDGGGPDQPKEGLGDIGNYVPLAPNSSWSFQGTDQTTGRPPIPYSNFATISGTKSVGGVVATVLSETNPLNEGRPEDNYYTKDSHGFTFHGNNDPTDILTAQLVPHQTLRFPLETGLTFEQINKKGLDSGEDIDRDGTKEKADLVSIVTVKGFESVTVPAGTFSNCARVETRATSTVIKSSNRARVTEEATQTMWFASGVGRVKLVPKLMVRLGRRN